MRDRLNEQQLWTKLNQCRVNQSWQSNGSEIYNFHQLSPSHHWLKPNIHTPLITIADYQELNMEHRSLTTDTSVVRSWSPFTGFLKTYLSFYEKLTLYLANLPSVMASSVYQFVIDTQRKELAVYKVTNGQRVEMMNQSFLTQFYTKKKLFSINRNETHWVIGSDGLPEAIADSSEHQVRYWGIACSSLKPVKLTFWKHVGR